MNINNPGIIPKKGEINVHYLYPVLIIMVLAAMVPVRFRIHAAYNTADGFIHIKISTCFIITKEFKYNVGTDLFSHFYTNHGTDFSGSAGLSLQQYGTIAKRILRYLSFRELKWMTVFATGNPMSTAIGSAGLWTFKGVMTGYLSSLTRLSNNTVINVEPDFNNKDSKTQLICIFSIRIVHIIFIAGYALMSKIRRYQYGITAGKPEASH